MHPLRRPPWRLIELGEGPVAGQLETGWVRVECSSDSRWLLPDNGPEGLALLARDLRSLPKIACGDKVRLWPGDIPLSIRHAAGWSGTDSLTVRWQCFDQTSLAGLFIEEIQQDSASADQWEAQWISMLQIHRQDTQRHDGVPLRMGEEVTLSISTPEPMVDPATGDRVRHVQHGRRRSGCARYREGTQPGSIQQRMDRMGHFSGRLWRGSASRTWAACPHASPVQRPGRVKTQEGKSAVSCASAASRTCSRTSVKPSSPP